MNLQMPTGLGALIAVIVLVLVLVLAVVGKLPWMIAGFLAALAAARLT